jgi:hypothetical protein
MDPNWKKWWKWQWDETKKYFDLRDSTRRTPPFIIKVAIGFALFGLLLLILSCAGVL